MESCCFGFLPTIPASGGLAIPGLLEMERRRLIVMTFIGERDGRIAINSSSSRPIHVGDVTHANDLLYFTLSILLVPESNKRLR